MGSVTSPRAAAVGVVAAAVALLGASVLAQRIISQPASKAEETAPCGEHVKRIKAVDKRLEGWQIRCDNSERGVVVLQRSDIRYVRALLHGPGAPTSGADGSE